MRTKIKEVIDGKEVESEVEAVPIDYFTSSEPWTKVDVDDGAELRVRSIISNVLRLPDDRDGNARYHLDVNVNVRVVKQPDPPEQKRK